MCQQVKLKEKYRIIRDQKIRERVEALGVKIQGDEDREKIGRASCRERV